MSPFTTSLIFYLHPSAEFSKNTLSEGTQTMHTESIGIIRPQSNRRNSCPLFIPVLLGASFLLCAVSASAAPRSPWPPLPELGHAILLYDGFNGDGSFSWTNAEVLVPDYGALVESWSGYALERAGAIVPPFTVPAVGLGGHTNVACGAGAVRFWLKSYWSSGSAGGSGPDKSGRLLELTLSDEVSPVWSLMLSTNGNTMSLVAETGSGAVELLSAAIAWEIGRAHCVALNYGPQGTALLLDGQVAATGAGTLAVPPQMASLTVGSTLAGTDTAA